MPNCEMSSLPLSKGRFNVGRLSFSARPKTDRMAQKIIREIYMTMMQHILLRLPAGDRTLKSYATEWGDK